MKNIDPSKIEKQIIDPIISFIPLISIVIIFSCTSNNQQQTKSYAQDTITPLTIDNTESPVVTFLDNCPPPRIIVVPEKASGSYTKQTEDGIKKIKLLPPITKPADFYVPMQYYNVEEGLALNSVLSSFCDKDGNLWFGTYGGGVSKYDGKSFTNYTTNHGLFDNQVFSIFQDDSGNLWFGTWNGVAKYDGKGFKKYSTNSIGNGLPCCVYSCIFQDKNGDMWFGTTEGLSRYNGISFKTYFPEDGLAGYEVNCIVQDREDNMWFGTDKGISCYDGKSFRNFTKAQGLIDARISCVLQDKDGNIWFGSKEGISKYDGKRFRNFTTSQGLVNNDVTNLLEDKNGHLWVGTKNGVSEYDGISFKNYTTKNGLVSNDISSMVKDKNENIWFTTLKNGICRYSGESFTSYTKAQGLGDDGIISVLQEKNGMLWFGSLGNGAVRYDGKSFTYFTTKQGLADNIIFCIYQDKNENIWFATDDGISRYDGKSFTTYTTKQGLGANRVWSITEDKKGNMWFGTFGGGVSMFCSDKKSFTTFSIAQGLLDDNIHDVFADKKGNIWLGYDDGGITCYDGKLFKHYTDKQGLTNGFVSCIFEDRNSNLWFGTSGGASRYDGKSFMKFTPEQGLPDEAVYDITEDKNGIIWFGTRLGFSGLRFKEKKTEKINISADISFNNKTLEINYEPIFETYNFKNGYPVRDIWSNNAMYVDSSNILWAGTSDKLIRFDNSSMYKNSKPPNVFIQAVRINNKNICWHDLENNSEKNNSDDTPPTIIEEIAVFGKPLNEVQRDTLRKQYKDLTFDSITRFYPVPLNLVLPHKYNDITFDFAAIEVDRPGFVNYQYMLEGYDDDWSPASNEKSVSFGNMYERNYTFKLKAQSPDGVWSKPLTYTFIVLPPWYRTWWAYGLYLLIFIAALREFIRWRTGVLKKEKTTLEERLTMQSAVMNERTRISRELHDEVGATLSGIAMYSHLTKEQVKQSNTTEVEKSLNIMQQSAGEMVNKLNDIVWLINPDQDSLQKLIQRLEEYARDMAAIKTMQVKVNVPSHLAEHSLPVESRRNIYLFCKEAINNAVKYSNGTLLELNIKEVDNKLEFSVSDNGKGFDAVMVRRGNGLENMQKRADEIGAKLTVQSKQDEGSLVSMQIKIT